MIRESEINHLRALLDDPDETVAASVRSRIREILSAGSEFDLGEAVFAIALLDDWRFSRQEWDSFVCGAVAGFGSEDSPYKTALERLSIFNWMFFREMGFRMDDNGPASVSEVIRLRSGQPVTVALLYFTLAHEAGLPLRPLVCESGFVPVWFENGRELFAVNLLEEGEPAEVGDHPQAQLQSLAVLPELWMGIVSAPQAGL